MLTIIQMGYLACTARSVQAGILGAASVAHLVMKSAEKWAAETGLDTFLDGVAVVKLIQDEAFREGLNAALVVVAGHAKDAGGDGSAAFTLDTIRRRIETVRDK